MRTGHQPSHRGLIRTLALASLLAGLVTSGGCGSDKGAAPQPSDFISPRVLPSDVVENLQAAYKSRNVAEYSKLLASDFQFWFDPATRTSPEHPDLPEFWTRLQDSTGTGNLFASDKISNVKIELTYGSDVPDSRVGHGRWRKIEITDTFLSIDKAPDDGGEPTTIIVDGDLQAFYLRKGRTSADTLAISPTSGEWFLVEWRDLGQPRLSAARGSRAMNSAATERSTWSSIKGLYGGE